MFVVFWFCVFLLCFGFVFSRDRIDRGKVEVLDRYRLRDVVVCGVRERYWSCKGKFKILLLLIKEWNRVFKYRIIKVG